MKRGALTGSGYGARADEDLPTNDSVFVQFSHAVSAAGTPLYAIRTTSALVINIEDCISCGLDGWGWQDTGAGVEVLGPVVRFATTGPERIRIQTREGGMSIDQQVVLSPMAYLSAPPGTLKRDRTILPPR